MSRKPSPSLAQNNPNLHIIHEDSCSFGPQPVTGMFGHWSCRLCKPHLRDHFPGPFIDPLLLLIVGGRRRFVEAQLSGQGHEPFMMSDDSGDGIRNRRCGWRAIDEWFVAVVLILITSVGSLLWFAELGAYFKVCCNFPVLLGIGDGIRDRK